MNRKKYFFTVIFLIPFLIFCQESNGVKIVHPDARDSSYSFIGEWKITETFKLDPQWAADIYDPKIAEAIIGEKIIYENGILKFRNKEYHMFEISNRYFTTEQLKKATTGSGVKSYNFKDLHIPDDIKVIRDITIFYEEKEYPIFGYSLFVVNSETILIHWLGWIFKAERVK